MTAIVFAALFTILPPNENKAVLVTAREYNLTEEQTALLCAIRRVENGRPCLAFGINDPRARIDDADAFARQARWCAGTIRKRYTGDVDAFARRYSPRNWRVWARNVKWFLRKQGVEK